MSLPITKEPFLAYLQTLPRPSEQLRKLPDDELKVLTGSNSRAMDYWAKVASIHLGVSREEFFSPHQRYLELLTFKGGADYGSENYIDPYLCAIRAASQGNVKLTEYFIDRLRQNSDHTLFFIGQYGVQGGIFYKLFPILREKGLDDARAAELTIYYFAYSDQRKLLFDNIQNSSADAAIWGACRGGQLELFKILEREYGTFEDDYGNALESGNLELVKYIESLPSYVKDIANIRYHLRKAYTEEITAHLKQQLGE